jgi:hypothetical protein
MFFQKYSFKIKLSSGQEIALTRFAKSRKDLFNYYSLQKYYYYKGFKNKIIQNFGLESEKPELPQKEIQIQGQPVIITEKLLEILPY